MKLPFTNQAGDDVGSLISNPQVDERFEPRHLGSYVVVSRRARAAGNRKSAIANHQSRSGIALVITLILLSVTLVMAVAFLAISNRERSSVTTTTDATTARLAAETALAQAEGQIISTMLATTNPYNYGLLVSTNYINGNGFDPAAEAIAPNPTNVNYDYLTASAGGGPPSLNQIQQTIANLFFSPRAPVFIVTNQSSGASDFRFYLDLNRNGRFETNGYSPMFSSDPVLPYVDTNGFNTANLASAAFNNFVGDPEWIGVLERPDTTHGPNNKFLSRYAFVALPVGNTLDVNYIHNAAFNPTAKSQINTSGGDFRRNEGVGGWEINLAAFFHDLNTNSYAWGDLPLTQSGYFYDPLVSGTVSGSSFVDAMEFYRYRLNGLRTGFLATDYAYNTAVLNSVNNLFGTIGDNAFSFDQIDGYSDGPFMTTNTLPFDNDSADINYPWPGADNANHFFTPGEFFDPAKTSGGALGGFTNRLLIAGSSPSTYDRYTFYRMLSQLGTDSSPESGLMNVNYDNLDPGFNGILNVNGTASVTNFVPWTAIGFFTNAADRMLRLYTTNWFQSGPSNYLVTYYGLNYPFPITINQFGEVNGLTNAPFFGMTNQIPAFGITSIPVFSIPVLINGQFVYSSAMQRVLQLAANMYDAIYYTNHTFGGAAFPSVFKPVFGVTNGNVYITNFVEVSDTAFFGVDTIRNLKFGPTAVAALQPNDLVFGVPLIIGAKKGFPNFNEFYMENTFQLTRKLMATRTDTNATVALKPTAFSYYEMFSLSLSNHFGVELWNSYRTNYTRLTDIYVTNYLSMTLTNDEGFNAGVPTDIAFSGYLQIPNATNIFWSGYNSNFPSPSFQIPLATNFAGVPDSIYRFNDPAYPYPYNLSTNLALPFETNFPTTFGKFPQPHWGLTMTNNLQVIMVDDATRRIIDYVQLSGPNSVRDLSAEIQQGYEAASGVKNTRYNNQWNTSLTAGVPIGISEQLNVSQGLGIPIWSATLWGPDEKSAYDQMNAFNVFLNGKSAFPLTYPGYTGFTPTQIGIAASTNAMQAPYTPAATVVQHITWQANDPLVHYLASDLNAPFVNGLDILVNWPANLGKLNQRYMPWGGNPLLSTADTSPYALALKDPLIYSSDNWDFPTNKFPTVGWLGRVHRGTPWQTVYLKATNILNAVNGLTNWASRTGNTNVFDLINTRPTQDHLLFDLFTTAPNDNATRGQLSVNVGAVAGGRSLAAWSALFSGMVVPPTSPTNTYTVIAPAGVANTTSPLWQVVTNINNTRDNTNLFPLKAFAHKGDILVTPQLTEQSPFLNLAKTNYNSDEMYEWLPQQAMSLLRAPSAPRYVIYCYGQALKPAQNSTLTGGTFFQMCTNYQVVTESAARAVIRVEDATTPHPHIVVESFNLLPPD